MHREENQVKVTERQRHSIVKLSEPGSMGFLGLEVRFLAKCPSLLDEDAANL